MTASQRVRDCLALAVQANVPVMAWGEPGTSKTKTIESIGAALYRYVLVLIASIREPSDFAGIPVADLKRDLTRYLSPRWVKSLIKSKNGVLFLDELPTAPPAVQAVLLRVVLEKWVGEHQLPDLISIVAAGNPPNLTAGGGYDLSAALANRFLHLDWPTGDAEDWAIGRLLGWPKPNIPILKDGWWQRHEGRAVALVTGYIRSRPEALHVLPKTEAEQGRAWPSKRSWDYLGIRSLAAILEVEEQQGGICEYRNTMLGGCIGEAHAAEFFTWEQALDLPKTEDLLKDPKSSTIPDRTDQLHVVLGGILHGIVANRTEARWNAAVQICHRVAVGAYKPGKTGGQNNRDLAGGCAKKLAELKEQDWSTPGEFIEFVKIFSDARIFVNPAAPKPRGSRTRKAMLTKKGSKHANSTAA